MERRDFKAGKELISLMMKYQGTDLRKAISEVVQNSIDADSANINITITKDYISVIDDGSGMTEEIIRNEFETIGDSTKRDDETKIGFFGIGILQMMQYGRITIESLFNKIEIDVRKNGLSYTLDKLDKKVDGTNSYVELYDGMESYRVSGICRQLERTFYMVKSKVFINKKLIEPDYKIIEQNEIFEAFKLKDSSYGGTYGGSLYAMGIYVKDSHSIFNVSYNVKKKIETNFARNDFVESNRKKRFIRFIQEIEERHIKKRNKFGPDLAKIIVDKFMAGDISLDTIKDKELILLANGKRVSINVLKSYDDIYFAKGGSKLADRALRRGYLVVDKRFERAINRIAGTEGYEVFRISMREELPAEVLTDKGEKMVDINELFKHLKSQVKRTLFYAAKFLNDYVFEGQPVRELKLMKASKELNGWTDGSTYITINMKFFMDAKIYESTMAQIYRFLCHEYAHTDESKNSNEHEFEFYERFHKIMESTIGRFGEWLSDNRYSKVQKEASNFIKK